jgi:hypothetical protein
MKHAQFCPSMTCTAWAALTSDSTTPEHVRPSDRQAHVRQLQLRPACATVTSRWLCCIRLHLGTRAAMREVCIHARVASAAWMWEVGNNLMLHETANAADRCTASRRHATAVAFRPSGSDSRPRVCCCVAAPCLYAVSCLILAHTQSCSHGESRAAPACPAHCGSSIMS